MLLFKKKLFIFLSFLIFFPLKTTAYPRPLRGLGYPTSHSDKEITTALKVLEQGLFLSPEFLDKTKDYNVIPFYEVDGHKVYLDEGFWLFTRTWLKIYIEEIEKHCSCDLDPDLMLEEVKNYVPQHPLVRTGKGFLSTVLAWVGRFSYSAAVLKLQIEAVESVFLGPFHIACNAGDIFVILLARKLQRYNRAFFYGGKLHSGRFRRVAKMAWLFHKVKKKRKRINFYIAQALDFIESQNMEGGHPASLWIRALKEKTDPLFKNIEAWERKLQDESLNWYEQKEITINIQKARKQIEKISEVTRKDFFGIKFRDFLLLRVGRGFSGKQLQDKALGRRILWPLSLQQNTMERFLKPPDPQPEPRSMEIPPDEIREGLIEEFLLKKEKDKRFVQTEDVTNKRKAFLQSLLYDIDQVFNTEASPTYRLMKADSIGEFLGATLFNLYFELVYGAFVQKYNLTYGEQNKLLWIFSHHFFRLIDEFSDFLSVVSTIKDKKKIQFYKYESMEKLLAFFDNAHGLQSLLNTESGGVDKQAFFEKLQSEYEQSRSIALLKRKNSVSGIMKRISQTVPFMRSKPQCIKLAEKYQ